MTYVVYLLVGVLLIQSALFLKFFFKHKALVARVNFVESQRELVETYIELTEDLNRFGKATMEVRRLDPSGIFYREPIA